MSRDENVARNYSLEGEVGRLYGVQDSLKKVEGRLRIA